MGPPIKRQLLLELLQANYDTFRSEGGIPIGLVYTWMRREKLYARTKYAAKALQHLHEANIIEVSNGKVRVV